MKLNSIFYLLLVAFFFFKNEVNGFSKRECTLDDVFNIRKSEALGLKEVFGLKLLIDQGDWALYACSVSVLSDFEEERLFLYYLTYGLSDYDFVFFDKEMEEDIVLYYFVDRLNYISSGIKFGYIHFNEDNNNFQICEEGALFLHSDGVIKAFGDKYGNRIFRSERFFLIQHISQKISIYLDKHMKERGE